MLPAITEILLKKEISAAVLVLGGGIAGCWAAISAAKKGVKVAIVEKGATIRSGAGGRGVTIGWVARQTPLVKLPLKSTHNHQLRPLEVATATL